MNGRLKDYLEKLGDFLNSRNGLILLSALHGTSLVLNIRSVLVRKKMISAVSAGIEAYMLIKTLRQLSGKGEISWGRSLRR